MLSLRIWFGCAVMLLLVPVLVPLGIAWEILKGAWGGLLHGLYHYVPTMDSMRVLFYGLTSPRQASKMLQDTPEGEGDSNA